MHAIREIDFRPPPAIGLFNLIHCRRAKILARIAVLFGAAIDADVEIEYVQMRWLIDYTAQESSGIAEEDGTTGALP